MTRPSPLTIPVRSNLEPDLTPPAPTCCEIPAHLRNMSRKRMAADSDDEMVDPTEDLRAPCCCGDHEKSSGTPVRGDAEPLRLPNAPICAHEQRSVKRPRSVASLAMEDDGRRQGTLASLLDSISLMNHEVRDSKTDGKLENGTPLSATEKGFRPCVLDKAMRSFSWTAGEKPKKALCQKAHLVNNALSPSRPESPAGEKRRRSVSGFGGGPHVGEHHVGNQRAKQKRASVSILSPCPTPVHDRPSPGSSSSSETLADWPPWAGDAPAWRQNKSEADALDPGSCVREAMRAQLRKRLGSKDGASQLMAVPLADSPFDGMACKEQAVCLGAPIIHMSTN